jgi:hypothetical protein
MKILASEDDKRNLLIYAMRDLCEGIFPENIVSCLIQASQGVDNNCVKRIVLSAIDAGVVFFLMWGDRAEYLHDVVDDMIESADIDLSHIVTTHHEDESFEDVAWLLMRSTYFGPNKYRCLAVFQDDEFDKDELIKAALLAAVNSK